MRGRAWIAWGALTLGVLLGLLARFLPGRKAWDLLAVCFQKVPGLPGSFLALADDFNIEMTGK